MENNIRLTPTAIYNHVGRQMIARDETTLTLIGGAEDTVYEPNSGTVLIATPGSIQWNELMVANRRRLALDLANERRELQELRQWRDEVGQAILAKAEQHDWCEEYDDFAEEWDLPQREYEYDVTVSVRVHARNEERAEELVSENIDLSCYNDVFVVAGPDYSVDRAY